MKTIKREVLTIVLWTGAVFSSFVVGLCFWGAWHDEWSGYNATLSAGGGSCNIAVIPIAGEIIPFGGANKDGATYSEDLPASANPDDVASALRGAESDPNILGVLVRIDSYGGSPVASEIISNGIKRSSLPSVALIREAGDSGAYLIATGAHTIIASPFSDIGSIGITMSYIDNTVRNDREGLKYVSLTSAQYKDYGSPDKVLTAEENKLLRRDLKIYHEQFVKEVAENRGLPIEQVAKLADGSSMPGSLALENNLIDQLGDQETARKWFAEKLGVAMEEVVFCE